MNELIWILEILISFAFFLIFYKFLGKTGIYCWITLCAIIVNIQVIKTIQLFGFVATLGNILYATSFLATDVLSENYSKKEANKGVMVGFLTLIFTILIMQISLKYIPESSNQEAQLHLEKVFSFLPRIGLASLIAYLISQFHDVWAYHFWKNKFKKIWIANNFSTFISQLIDSIIFTIVAFWGYFEFNILLEIIFTTYIFKLIVAVIDTPFVYLAKKMKEKFVL